MNTCRSYNAGYGSEIQTNPQMVKTLDKNLKPHYEFEGYEPVIEKNPTYHITQQILTMVVDEQDKACINAIKLWAKENGYDDVLLMDESKLKEIITLGSAEYERLHVEDSQNDKK